MNQIHIRQLSEWGRVRCSRIVLLVVLYGLTLAASLARGEESSFSEYQVKALFLLNFARYVDWPASAFTNTSAPVQVGVCGGDKVGDLLEKAVAGKSFGGRSIVIRRLSGTADAAHCQILFISASEKKQLREVLASVRDLPVLTVGECPEFVGAGGIINFIMRDGRVRLEIDLDSARRAGLQISSRLLSVADVVHGKT